MVATKTFLTNERLGKRFTNSFELVNYAIELGKQMIRSGRACRLPTPIQNRAFQLLLEIAEHKDSLELLEHEEQAAERAAAAAIAVEEIVISTPKIVDLAEKDEDEEEELEDEIEEASDE